jgi:CheY-like chemotaxis protein
MEWCGTLNKDLLLAQLTSCTWLKSIPISMGSRRKIVVNILLVEDNEMNRDMLSRRLKKKGFEVAMAFDGKQGVEMAQAQSPDLILLDMSLPVMDGWEAAGHLKSNGSTSSIPVIALTAHAMAGDKEKALEAGCDDYDTKPIDFKRLLGKINELLG